MGMALLWTQIDHDKDGICDFDEFIDFVFSASGASGKPDWKAAEKAFHEYAKGGANKLMDGREFVKLCHECELFDDNEYGVTDADICFKKVENKREARGINFKEFKKLLKIVAKKKTMPLVTLVKWIGSVKHS